MKTLTNSKTSELSIIKTDKMSIYARHIAGQYYRITPLAKPWEAATMGNRLINGCDIQPIEAIPAKAIRTPNTHPTAFWGVEFNGLSWVKRIRTPAGLYTIGVMEHTAVVSSYHDGPVAVLNINGINPAAAAVELWGRAVISDPTLQDRPAKYWQAVLEASPIGADMALTAHIAAESHPFLTAMAASPALANLVGLTIHNIFAVVSPHVAKRVTPRPIKHAIKPVINYVGGSSLKWFQLMQGSNWAVITNETGQLLGAPKPIAIWRIADMLTGVMAGTYLHAINMPFQDVVQIIQTEIFGQSVQTTSNTAWQT